MQKKDTKNEILIKSLELFSVNGYEGTSIRDIAKEVGIKESSIYKHYKNKQDIFDSILVEMTNRYGMAISSIGIPNGESEEVANDYLVMPIDNLLNISRALFLFFLKDEVASAFRKMLTIEQFRNTMASKAFEDIFIDGAVNFQAELFSQMINKGGFIECDPYTMALHFYSPIFLLLAKYDGKPEQETDAINKIENHVKQFAMLYTRG